MAATEKQFAGNYVRLVNKSRSLEQDVILRDRMIALMAKDFMFYAICPKAKNEKGYIDNIKNKALSELVAEQNKKAANVESI